MQYVYISILTFSIISLLISDRTKSYLLFSKQRKKYIFSIVATIIVFLCIDYIGVVADIFYTNKKYVVGFDILTGIPLEEVLFLFLVSYVTLLINKRIPVK